MTRDVSVTPFTIPLKTPLRTGAGTIEGRRGFLLTVDGAYGEATPLPGWTEDYDECKRVIETAANLLQNGRSWDDAIDICSDTPAARHAVTLARLDHQAKRHGISIAESLTEGEDFPRTIPVNDTIGHAPARETAAHARRAVTSGFDCLKIKVGGRPVPGDVERLRAVRKEVGADIELRADANGSWTPGQAREAMDAFDDLGVTYVEQPLPADDLSALASLRKETSIGVALDESLATNRVGDVLMIGAADVLILKPMALGGIERTHTLGRRASELDVTPIVTTTIDAVVARTAALHVAAGLGGDHACGLATASKLSTDLAEDPAPVINGTMRVPADPGLGVSEPSQPDEQYVHD